MRGQFHHVHVHVCIILLSLGGGGLKLTISKAVLKQATHQQKPAPPPSSSPLSTTLFVGPAPTLEVEPSASGRGGRRGSRGGSRRGTCTCKVQYLYNY